MRYIIFSVLFLFSIAGNTKTLLLSDIDDTIKLAHIKNYAAALKYAFDDQSRFLGMSFLYTKILQDQTDAKMVYLTKGPQWAIGKTHRHFLKNGEFPQGLYIPRTQYDEDVHKLKTIRNLLADMKPDKVIFIGDNGEQDADVYAKITQEYANQGIEFHQFIRIAYDRNSYVEKGAVLHDGQIGFVSPVEIALELEKNFLISFSSVQEIVDKIVPEILNQKFNESEGIVAIPYYVKCSDFMWKWDDNISQFAPLAQLKMRFAERCNLKNVNYETFN